MQQILTPAMIVYDDLSDEYRMYENVLQAAHNLEEKHPDYLIDDFKPELRDVSVYEMRDVLPPDVQKRCMDDEFLIGLQVAHICHLYGIKIETPVCTASDQYDVRVPVLVPKWRENDRSENYERCPETGQSGETEEFTIRMDFRDFDLISNNTIYQRKLQQLGELNG